MTADRNIEALEARLAALTGRRHCVLASRATTALYLAFRELGRAPGGVVLPAILCPSPAYAALYAGHRPVFCDIDPATGNMDPRALDMLLAATPDTIAVMPTHLYGTPADMDAIGAIAARHGVPVVEDAAQALGASLRGGAPAGGAGDCAVLSFGHTKIVDAGYGGALVTDDDGLAQSVRGAERRLPARAPSHGALAADYRDRYYAIRAAAATNPGAEDAFLEFPERYRSLFLQRYEPERTDIVAAALDALERTVDNRRRKAAIYDEILASAPLTPLDRAPGSTPWRYNLLIGQSAQTPVTEGLRAAGFDASNWYPSLHRWFGSGRAQDERALSNALRHERRIINLWLDDATSDARILACAQTLGELASTPNPAAHPA